MEERQFTSVIICIYEVCHIALLHSCMQRKARAFNDNNQRLVNIMTITFPHMHAL